LHAVERCWEVVKAFGGGHLPIRFHVPLQPAALRWATSVVMQLPRPWLFVAVGARWETKRWPPHSFASLLTRAQTAFGGTVILIGGTDEVPLSQAVAQSLAGPVHDLTGQTTLPQLAALLSQADVLLGNDSGPLHLAAALGRPVVAPYTCTRTERHGPYGPTGRAVETAVACRGSYRRHCADRICQQELTPDRLWPALGEVLATWHYRNQTA
jgi:ADP-heptose:LPS heptosyltransferase